ncbi:D-Ala-D-Ala carboxypeptidase family metallohydrolase [Xylanibacter oryzae]|uniref:D-Ala-D-Ala carboxypeptidase family metallohydrolase n=1 Tax=Xylanibacter oryzae TaxID=185293 RepID=UPI0004B56934|nr:D-Ala-D-Ala carboxypeptidase family metallohydrolase [Xylanibacter oryzae]
MDKLDIHQLLSEHFMLSEFIRSHTADNLHINNTPDEGIIENLRKLCTCILEPTRIMLKESIIVTSGYRCKLLNKRVGGAGKSQHLSGKAADLHIRSKEYAVKLWQILMTNNHVDQLLWEHDHRGSEWIHVSYSDHPRHFIDQNFKANATINKTLD